MGRTRRIWNNCRMRLLTVLGCFAAIICVGTTAVPANQTKPIIRIEEDWTLEISEPATNETSPQITNTMCPTQNLNGFYGVFEINHGTQPDYNDGGLELQMWEGDRRVIYRRNENSSRLNYRNELVKFTLAMQILDRNPDNYFRRLRYEIRNGSSLTWGAFGTDGSFRCTTQWTDTDTFANYSPAFSVANSRIGYASFRVKKYALKTVRYYNEDGLVSTDNTERVAFEYNANAVITE